MLTMLRGSGLSLAKWSKSPKDRLWWKLSALLIADDLPLIGLGLWLGPRMVNRKLPMSMTFNQDQDQLTVDGRGRLAVEEWFVPANPVGHVVIPNFLGRFDKSKTSGRHCFQGVVIRRSIILVPTILKAGILPIMPLSVVVTTLIMVIVVWIFLVADSVMLVVAQVGQINHFPGRKVKRQKMKRIQMIFHGNVSRVITRDCRVIWSILLVSAAH